MVLVANFIRINTQIVSEKIIDILKRLASLKIIQHHRVLGFVRTQNIYLQNRICKHMPQK